MSGQSVKFPFRDDRHEYVLVTNGYGPANIYALNVTSEPFQIYYGYLREEGFSSGSWAHQEWENPEILEHAISVYREKARELLGPPEFLEGSWGDVWEFASDIRPVPGYKGPMNSFSQKDVDEILKMREGIRDEQNWLCVVRLKDGRFAFLTAWCDYTGFD